MTLIVDSGGLLSVLDARQDDHELFLRAVQVARGPLIVSPFVVAELDYLIFQRFGRERELLFLEEIASGAYRVEQFSNNDVSSARALCVKYRDLKGFGLADASNVVLAERYNTLDLLTTDTKDFRAVAGPGGRSFRIHPYDVKLSQ